MNNYSKPLPDFDLKKLKCLNFGNLEGETDSKLYNSFFITDSIMSLLKGKFNYVVSPKGGGKSAVFRALKDKLLKLPPELFDFKNYSFISINDAFVFNNDYLPIDHFKIEDNRKNYTLSWALYFLTEIIKDIKNNHNNKPNYNKLLNDLGKILELKESFRLYNLIDYINNFNIGITFSVSGLPLEATPKININQNYSKLVLNDIFKKVNDFYRENNLTALILIDRLDNFVRKESYHIQKNYIQGLIDCIEEITTLNNIAPVLFIRTDLYYSFDIDFEYDKVKERKKDLVWSEDETLNFIVYRLLSNDYINDNYYDYFDFIIEEGLMGKHRHIKINPKSILKQIKRIFSNESVKFDLKRTLGYTIAEKFIRLFFPKTLGDQKIDFCEWILENFTDSNSFVNPRTIIYFFNELFEQQRHFFKDNPIDLDIKLKAQNHTDELHFEIFKQEVIEETYKKVQNDELRNILKILKTSESQSIFKELNLRTLNKRKFTYGDINFKKLNVSKEEYESILKYLSLLGYCKEIEKQVYEIPKLFNYQMTL